MKLQITVYLGVLIFVGCASQPARTPTPVQPAVIQPRIAAPVHNARPAPSTSSTDNSRTSDKTGATDKNDKTSQARIVPAPKPGGYYLDDGPDENPPSNLDDVPDAVPKAEPLHKYANRIYKALGKTYTPVTSGKGYKARGIASWYGRRFHGKRTATGEPYDMYAMSAAHPTLPLPSYARVTSLENGKSVVVRVNDRGPFHSARIIDLSYTAAHKLGFVQNGKGRVEVESITPQEIAAELETASEAQGLYLQIGSFLLRANAEKLLARAATQLDARSKELVLLDQPLRYRVALGPYSDPDSVAQAEREVQQRMDLKPIRIVR